MGWQISPPEPPGIKLLGKEKYEELMKLVRVADNDWHLEINHRRIGGLEADIVSMKSLSLTRKHMLQRERDEATLALIQKAKDLTWW